jgi:hypothetical protein
LWFSSFDAVDRHSGKVCSRLPQHANPIATIERYIRYFGGSAKKKCISRSFGA